MQHVAIIGNGISGITTARQLRKRTDCQITVISSESKYFFSRTALMYIYMGHMKFEHTKPYEDWFWKKNRIDLIEDHVQSIDFGNKTLALKNRDKLSYDKLVIATGSKPNKFGWPGENLKGVQGLYSVQDLEEMVKNSDGLKSAVIVGGGLIGVEMAEMFLSRNIAVSFLVREDSFWNKVLPKEESEMVNKHMREHHVDLRLETELKEIKGDENNIVKSIITKSGEEIACGFVGLTVGVHPNIDFLKDTALELDKGILINRKQETNIDGVYAVGDCAQHREPLAGRAPIEQIWYTGKLQGENCAKVICGEESEYQPGMFFNSAKFFDIEYQVYGYVPVNDQGTDSLFWQSDDQKQSIRIVFDKEDLRVVGFNLMGVRYRHEICEKWIRNGAHIKEVVQNLSAVNFDPEFHKKHEPEIARLYQEKFGESLKQKPLKKLQSFIFRSL